MNSKLVSQEVYYVHSQGLKMKKIAALAVLARIDIGVHKKMNRGARTIKFDIVKSILKLGEAGFTNMKGDYIIGLFQNTKDALFSAQKLKYASKTLDISVRIGLDYGLIYDEPVGYPCEVESSCVDTAIRLASIAQPDEIVLSESLYGDGDLDHKRFVFLPQCRQIKTPENEDGSAEVPDCYVMMLINDREA